MEIIKPEQTALRGYQATTTIVAPIPSPITTFIYYYGTEGAQSNTANLVSGVSLVWITTWKSAQTTPDQELGFTGTLREQATFFPTTNAISPLPGISTTPIKPDITISATVHTNKETGTSTSGSVSNGSDSAKSKTATKEAVSTFSPNPDGNGTYPDGTYTCKAAASDSNICSVTSSSNSPNVGLKAGVGVLAALFILALGGFLFLLFRRRHQNDTDHHSAPYIAPPSDSSHASDAEKLRTRIVALEQQLAVAQSTLLATAVSMPTPIDDRTIASRFDGLAQEIKDWSLTHLRRNPGPHEFSPDLRELLRARVPDFERLLTIPKTRGLVVRAAVSAILADAFEDGYLFPGGTEVRAVEKRMRKNMSDSDFNSWRCSTYASIAASFGSERDLLPALEPLAQRIDALVAPFADAQESGGRLKYLHRILYTFATLCLTLLSQPARFHILDPKPPPTFDCRTMDDVLQEYETKYLNTGRPENPLQGRQCSAVVFPGVEKWGNGQLGSEAEWGSLVVVVKARVLV